MCPPEALLFCSVRLKKLVEKKFRSAFKNTQKCVDHEPPGHLLQYLINEKHKWGHSNNHTQCFGQLPSSYE